MLGYSQIRTLLFCFLLQMPPNLMQSQTQSCFEIQKILPVRYEPSKKLKLQPSDEKEIIFKVDVSRRSQMLENRVISLLDVKKEDLTPPQIERLYSLHSGLGEYSDFIFVQIKAENVVDAIVSTRLSNEELEKNKKLDEAPNHFGLSISKAMSKFRIAIIANQTDSIIQIPHILSRITLLQEAKDTSGIWRPIESSSNNLWCGNTDHGMINLKPNEFIEVYPRRHCGRFQTKMRMKLQLKNKVIYSEEYEGHINPEIFDSIDFPADKYFIDISVEEEFKRVKALKNKAAINKD